MGKNDFTGCSEENGEKNRRGNKDKGGEHSRRRRKEGAVAAVGDTVAHDHHLPHRAAVALDALKAVGVVKVARAVLVQVLRRRFVLVLVLDVALALNVAGLAQRGTVLVVARQTLPARKGCCFKENKEKQVTTFVAKEEGLRRWYKPTAARASTKTARNVLFIVKAKRRARK